VLTSLQDPVFNTSLIIGYYWIPLCALFILYTFIFQTAWSLSKKSKVRCIFVSLFLICSKGKSHEKDILRRSVKQNNSLNAMISSIFAKINEFLHVSLRFYTYFEKPS
jgi:hypothetical protein